MTQFNQSHFVVAREHSACYSSRINAESCLGNCLCSEVEPAPALPCISLSMHAQHTSIFRKHRLLSIYLITNQTCPHTGLLVPTAAARQSQQCPAAGIGKLHLQSAHLSGRLWSGKTVWHARQAHLACPACSMPCTTAPSHEVSLHTNADSTEVQDSDECVRQWLPQLLCIGPLR